MSRRRGNSEGTIYKRRDGRWEGAITLAGGRRRRVYARTQKAARARLRELQDDLEKGRIIGKGRALTVGRYLEHWVATTLQHRLASGRLKASTVESYSDIVRAHIIPTLGAEPLATLGPPAVRRWLTELLAKPAYKRRGRPLSARTVQYAHAVLRKALRDAMNDGYVVRNVATLVEPPLVRRAPIEPLTVAEAGRLLAAAAGDRFRTLWLVLLALGLRLGEALALRWEDLDLDAGTVTIRRTVGRVRGEPDPVTGRRTSTLVEGTPKTAGSWATLALPAGLVEVLRAHEAQQKRERMAAVAWVDPGLVFASKVGTWLEQRNVARTWADLCDAAEVRRVRVHDLRHAAASFMLAEGVEMKVIQTTLRHSRLATTADLYTHVLAEVQRQAADRMDGVLRSIGGAS